MIFNALDGCVDGQKDGKLSKEELAQAIDVFNSYDNGDKKLSKKELEAIANGFNEALGKGEKDKDRVKSGDIKDFIRNLVSATKDADYVSEVSDILKSTQAQQEAMQRQQQIEQLDNAAKKLGYEPTNNEGVYYNKDKNEYIMYDAESKSFKPAKYDNEKKTFAFKTEEEIKADAARQTDTPEQTTGNEKNDAPQNHKYVVQADESFTSVIKKSLKAQGNENPTKEEIQAAKEQFKKDNPGAVKKSRNGVEYLLVGAEVNLPAEVKSPKSKEEAIAEWSKRHPDLVWKGGKSDVTDAADNKKANGDLTADEKKAADEAAEKAGYRNSDCAGIYYDEANKQHYKYNTETKQLEKFDADNVFEDGTYQKNEKLSDGIIREKQYDKSGKIEVVEDKKTDGTSVTKYYDKNGKVATSTVKLPSGTEKHYNYEYKKDGSFKMQEIDENGNNIGEPKYYQKDGKTKITEEEYNKKE